MRRIVNDADRILNDIDRLEIDAEELELTRGEGHHHHAAEKIAIPDTEYDRDFWEGVDDEGLGGAR
jgi:nitrogen-specific signal transduction histidine kinase